MHYVMHQQRGGDEGLGGLGGGDDGEDLSEHHGARGQYLS